MTHEPDADRQPPRADPAAFDATAVVRSQQNALWRYLRLLGCRPDEAEDVLQDAFVRVLARYPHHAARELQPLLRTTARNRFLELRRRRQPELVAWSDAVDAWLAACPSALDDDWSEQLAACLAELSPRARTGLTLRHVDGRPIDDVARQLGLARTGALTLLQRSRDALRACLARRGVAAPPSATSTEHPATRIPS